ncbi:hypothetical protein C0992_005181, partial [Termitomyces sp. T32_za158]
ASAETGESAAAAKGSEYKGGSSGDSNKDKDEDDKELLQTPKSKTVGSDGPLPAVDKRATKLVTSSKHCANKIIPSYVLPAKTTFFDMQLCNLLVPHCDDIVLNTNQSAEESVRRIKGKKTAPAEVRWQFKLHKEACNKCWADNDPEVCWFPTAALPCYQCDALKRACTYSSIKSHGHSKVNPIVQRTFESRQLPSIPSIASLPLPSDQDEEEEKAEDQSNSPPVDSKGRCAAPLIMHPNWTPLPIPQVTGQEFLWLNQELHYPVSALWPCQDLEAYHKQAAEIVAVISRDMHTANAEIAGLKMRRRIMFHSLDILERYQNNCVEALQWQDDNQVEHTPPATFFPLPPDASLDP